jgi:hypothetical protein
MTLIMRKFAIKEDSDIPCNALCFLSGREFTNTQPVTPSAKYNPPFPGVFPMDNVFCSRRIVSWRTTVAHVLMMFRNTQILYAIVRFVSVYVVEKSWGIFTMNNGPHDAMGVDQPAAGIDLKISNWQGVIGSRAFPS